MSTLKLKGSTSGYVELTAPAIAGNNAITLPTTAGTLVLKDPSNNFEVGTGVTIGAGTSNTFTLSTNGSERIRVDSSGRLGIGTTNPQYTLDVVGDINFTGTFRQNGSQFVASRWTSGTGDDIYRLSGDVGIGTTNPQYALDVRGTNSEITLYTQTEQRINLNSFDNNRNLSIFNNGNFGIVGYTPSSNYILYYNYAEKYTYFQIDGTERLRINGSGNILIGSATSTGTASQNLQVTGGGYFSGNLGVGVTNPGQALDVSGSIRASSQLISSVSTGTAPFSVSSTTLVTNLNADLLDGLNSTSANTGSTIVARDSSGNFSAGTISAAVDGAARSLRFFDTRNTATTPQSWNDVSNGVRFDFKDNSTNGLSDGGTYNGVMYWRKYGASTDFSGGGAIELAYTDNARLWLRYGTSTSWGSWKRVLFGDNFDNGGNVRLTSLGVGANATGNTGEIIATGNITAYSSDQRLKENLQHIQSPLEKVQKLNGYTFDWNEKSKELGFTPKHQTNDIGLIAQEVQEVLPQAVAPAPFDRDTNEFGENVSKSGEDYLTIQYERLVPLLVEAIKEQQEQINTLKEEINNLKK